MNENGKPAAGDSLAESLYATHKKIYPRQVHGLFATLRTTGVVVLMGIYYGLPWLTWGERQAVLFDLPARKFYIFGLSFWPQDFFYLTALLILAALSLFFFTALAGRLWCGYACPQTVWTEVFLWIERKVEGNRPRQLKLDKARLSARKIRIKATKHGLWLLLSLWTGYTFVGYFTPITELGRAVLDFSVSGWEAFWMLFYGFATYGNAGWLREQVCIYMCPYARFQSAMVDCDTLVVSYDPGRGEPRGSRSKGSDAAALDLGDCVDCSICVQVCPTGIDIRDGLQYECIGCAACIDACDDVMDKVGYPKGLIRYTTENSLSGKAPRVLRLRIVIYGLILIVLTAAVGVGIATRVPLGLDVIRDRNTLFRETDEGLIENVYTLKILNKDEQGHTFKISAHGIADATLDADTKSIHVKSGEVRELVVRLQVDPDQLTRRSTEVIFQLEATDTGLAIEETARFLGPVRY